MYHVHDGRVHVRRRQPLVRPHIHHVAQRLPQHLRLLDVDGDELEQPVLRDDADDHGAVRLVVDVDDGDAARARLQHLATCFVERAFGVHGDGFDGVDAERTFYV
jgi:hypothetical protein